MLRIKTLGAFAGIAGFEHGFSKVLNPDGSNVFEPTALIEINQSSQQVLRAHFPGVDVKGDISDVDARAVGSPDVAVAGFPCTDTSIANVVRRGLEGDESKYFWEFHRLLYDFKRLVDATRPRVVVVENPVGVLSSPGVSKADGVDRTGWDMAAIVRAMEDLGYGWAYRVVDGYDFGTPQRRERVILVFHRGGDPLPAAQVLGLAATGGEAVRPRLIGTRGPAGPKALPGPAGEGKVLVFRKSARPRAALSKGGYETWPAATHANTLTGYDYGLPTRQTHLLVHDDGRVRTLTLTEWERLQGFPDDWTNVGISDSARGYALGAAMHVGMAHWLGQNIADLFRDMPLHPTAA